MNRTYLVKKEHRMTRTNPLFAHKNEGIWTFQEDEEYPGWIFCKVKANGLEGYIPKQILIWDESGKSATVSEDYSARELAVKPGDKVESNRELNGFAWCVNEDGMAGWIPISKL